MPQSFAPLDFPPFSGFPAEGFKFLARLERNNNKQWFMAHKGEYERYVKQPMQEFIASMALEFQSWAPEVTADPKRSMFRIYRDIRFSKDKTPYKTHVAAAFSLGGGAAGFGAKNSGGFYVHVSPKECYVGGGIWRPPNDYLREIRRKIAHDHKSFFAIVKNKTFVKTCGELDMDDVLKTMPHGYDSAHPAAEYLRLKSFIAGAEFAPEETLKPDFLKKTVAVYKAMLPLVQYLSEV